MIGNFLKPVLRVYVALYICFNVAGCATPAAWEYAEKQSNEPPTYRSITDVYFAALRDHDELRLCVLARPDSNGEPSPATLKINLQKFSKNQAERGMTKHDNTSLAYNSISEGSKLINKCEPTLQGAEELISVERIQVEGTDLTGALQQLAPEELTVYVLEQNGKSHIVVGSTDQEFPGLQQQSFIAHAEDNASKAGYLLVPFAVIGDVVIAAGVIVGGIIYGFLCVAAGGCG